MGLEGQRGLEEGENGEQGGEDPTSTVSLKLWGFRACVREGQEELKSERITEKAIDDLENGRMSSEDEGVLRDQLQGRILRHMEL